MAEAAQCMSPASFAPCWTLQRELLHSWLLLGALAFAHAWRGRCLPIAFAFGAAIAILQQCAQACVWLHHLLTIDHSQSVNVPLSVFGVRQEVLTDVINQILPQAASVYCFSIITSPDK